MDTVWAYYDHVVDFSDMFKISLQAIQLMFACSPNVGIYGKVY